MPRPVTVVAFDFDGTLSTGDTVVPFLRRVSGTARLTAGLLARWRRVLGALARRDRDALKAAAADVAFRGELAASVDSLGRTFAAEIIANRLREDTASRLRDHVAGGDHVVIVSASLEPYLRPVGDSLGVAAVLCTRLEVGADGVLSGRLLGANCRGEEKVRRLDAWFAEQGLRRADVELIAYGDSAGDQAMLAEADTGISAAHRTLAAWRSP